MKGLFLADLKGRTEAEIKQHIADNYAGSESGFDFGDPTEVEIKELRDDLEKYNILIAYESVGSWGCDSNSFFLLERIVDGALFENHGGHCSCYGFEGQWIPEETTLEYLKSDHFGFYTGGYDDESKQNEAEVKDFLKRLYRRK